MNQTVKKICLLSSIFCLLLSLTGCDAFVRKFTRKPKKENLPREEMVLSPIEYEAPKMSKEELYRQYLLYWKSWHDELIESLSSGSNRKKQFDCAAEAIKNLEQLKILLNEDAQKRLAVYLKQLTDLTDSIKKDTYASDVSSHRLNAERIKRNILRDFSYSKIKESLI